MGCDTFGKTRQPKAKQKRTLLTLLIPSFSAKWRRGRSRVVGAAFFPSSHSHSLPVSLSLLPTPIYRPPPFPHTPLPPSLTSGVFLDWASCPADGGCHEMGGVRRCKLVPVPCHGSWVMGSVCVRYLTSRVRVCGWGCLLVSRRRVYLCI